MRTQDGGHCQTGQGEGLHVRLFYIGLDSAEESLERIANRVRRGGHDIAQADVVRRFSGRWEALEKVLAYCDQAEFYDNGNGFVKVAEYRNGELRPVGNLWPRWLLEMLQAAGDWLFCTGAGLPR